MVLTHDKLILKCRVNFNKFIDIKIYHQINQHVEAVFKGITTTDYDNLMKQSFSGEMIALFSTDNENPIFWGTVQKITLIKKMDFTQVTILAKSLTCMMDISERCRSFQNINSSYIEVLNNVVAQQSGQAIYNVKDKHLSFPLIQYQETDWAFILRIASHFFAPVIV